MITATYLTLREHDHSYRQVAIGSDIVLDLDDTGRVLGIERIGGMVDTNALLRVIWALRAPEQQRSEAPDA